MYTLHITKQDLHFKREPEKYITPEDWSVFSLPEYFRLDRGNISVTNPNEETIEIMKGVAKTLNAKVQGDDGEEY